MPTNNDLPDRIKKAQQWQSSRYEIDKGLLDAGYKPDEIETAWQQIEVKPASHPQLGKILRILTVILIAYIVVIFLGLFVFHLLPFTIIPFLNFPLILVSIIVNFKRIKRN